MTRSDFINRFKNNINIDGKNQVASADATLVDLFINSHIVNNTLLLKQETDLIEPQLLWNHTKSEIFFIWRIGIVYCTS